MYRIISTYRELYSKRKPLKKWQNILFGLIFIVFGALILWMSFEQLKNFNEKNETFKPVVATIVDYHENEKGAKAIIVEYEVDGKIYKKKSGSYSTMPNPPIGLKVEIKYNPLNPEDAIFEKEYISLSFGIILGAFFILCGIAMAICGIIKVDTGKLISISFPPSYNPKKNFLWGGIITIIGIAMLWFSFSTIETYNDKNKTFKPVVATIVDHHENEKGAKAIIVEYEVDGKTYIKASDTYKTTPKSIGSIVEIKYNPLNPEEAMFANVLSNEGVDVMIPLGIFFIAMGVVFIFSAGIYISNQNQEQHI